MSDNNGNQELSNIEMLEKLQGTEELNKLLNNHASNYFEQNIGKKQREAYDNVDNAFKEVLGMDKPSDKKTAEWAKEIATKYKELEANKGSNTKLEEAIAEQKRLNKAKIDKLSNDLNEANKMIDNLKLQGAQQISKSELSSYLANKTFNATYGDTELSEILGLRMDRTVRQSKQHEGKTIYYKDAEMTQPYLNAVGDPMSAKEVADIVFGSLYQTSKKGGGTQDTTTNQKATEGEVVTLDVSSIKTREQAYNEIHKILAQRDIKPSNQKYLEITRATLKHYDLNKLPRS